MFRCDHKCALESCDRVFLGITRQHSLLIMKEFRGRGNVVLQKRKSMCVSLRMVDVSAPSPSWVMITNSCNWLQGMRCCIGGKNKNSVLVNWSMAGFLGGRMYVPREKSNKRV